MKHLKKFIESDINTKALSEYIDSCFVELLDINTSYKFKHRINSGMIILSYMEIPLKFRIKNNITIDKGSSDLSNVNSIIELGDKIKKYSLIIDECISKVYIEYPDIEYGINIANDSTICLTLFLFDKNIPVDDGEADFF